MDFIKVNPDNIASWMAKTYIGKKISNVEEIAGRMLHDEDIEAGDLIVLGMRDRFISVGKSFSNEKINYRKKFNIRN